MPLSSQDQQAIVDTHNTYRSAQGVNTPALRWDATLATGAQTWADNLAANVHTIQHSSDAQAGNVGENIASAGTAKNTPAQMVDMWGKTVVNGRSEQAQFKPGIMPNVSLDGGVVTHYTQMISRLSTSVGCGMTTDSTTGNDYLVCRYMQPGNLAGTGFVSPQPVPQAQVSVASATLAFGVDAANNVYYYSSSDKGTTWTPQYSMSDSRQMKQVSVASDLTVCGLDTSGAIWRGSLTDSPFTWTQMPSNSSAFMYISCGSATSIWGVGVNCRVYRLTGSSWTQVYHGGAKRVTVADDGTIWSLDTHGYAYRYTGAGADPWENPVSVTGWQFVEISCGSATNVWGVGLDGQYWKLAGSNFTSAAPGTGKQVSVASDGTAWSIGTDNLVYRLVSNAWTKLLV